ncbi:MAG TPA: PDZ domain-containing protein [Blastocatellia bacterium]|nr:PDZ domain-containing protein [Blastocatellia bacterium]
MIRITLAILCAICAAGACPAQDTPTLFQKPTVSRTQIVFVYAGDLWIVPREGGEAKRLTTGVGTETDPFFSPDGTMVAFTGQYDGNTDVYVVPAAGGVPKRLTYHPGNDAVAGWTNDGKRILFASGRNSSNPVPRLFTIGIEGGGLPEEVPLPMAERGSYSPDGAFIAYEPLIQWQPDWKRYHGGQQDVIWIAKLADSSIEKLPRDKSNDHHPMWIGDKVYFLSDRNSPSGAVSLFAFDTKSKKVEQLISNDGLDIKSASAGPGVIAYEQFGTIHLYDLKSKKAQKVNIRVNADLASVRPRFERVGARISNAKLSPTGARAVFEARGEIITVPAEKGDPRNLTRTPGVMERDPAWSPDGKWIAYFSDESGEYALHLSSQSGMGEVKKIGLGNPPSFFYSPVWSPDSKKIAFTDKRLNLWYLEIDKGTPVKVDTNTYENPWRVMDPNWSPDSKWIAYTKQLRNRLCAVFAYSLDAGKATQITDGLSDARYAAFDKNGKYLYFTASTDAGPTTGWLDMSSFPFQTTRSVYLVVLKKGEASPLAPESDEEKVAEEKKDEAPKGPPQKKEVVVTIDFDGISQRILSLPIPARNYIGLDPAKSGLIFLSEAPGGGLMGNGPATVHKFDLEKRKFDKVLEGVTFLDVSANGEKALYRQGQNWTIASIATLGQPLPPGAPGAPNVLKVSEMEVQVDPKAEWKQMYNEAWRIQRDFLYDPNLHGLDLKATEKRYEPYLNAVAHRADLNYLFDEMLNNIGVGHHFVRGGEMPNPNFVPGGLLGCDYKIENGRYRLAKIYNGENWNPGLRAPLTQPGVEVKEGEYLLAVNGRNLTANDNIYQFFEATANKQVVIRVGPNPDGTGSREVTVVPVANENGLRNRDWMEGNRRKVDQLSGGRLAYIYLPDTGGGGYTNFNRYYFSQIDKEGAVVDERFNGGGTAANYIIDYMRRPLMNKWATREGEDFPTPAASIFGPKAMIINEFAGSGGDMMPWLFRKAGVGPTVGKRTWGGLVGIYDYPALMDGGMVTAPRVAFYNLQGEWDVENYGTPADIEVEFDPAAWRQGRDPQLEKAVEAVLEQLKKNPLPKYQKPAYPNYQTGRAAKSQQ